MFGDSGYERLVRVNRFLAPVLTFLHLLSALWVPRIASMSLFTEWLGGLCVLVSTLPTAVAGILFINVLIAMLNTRYARQVQTRPARH